MTTERGGPDGLRNGSFLAGQRMLKVGLIPDAPPEVAMTDRPQPRWTCPQVQELKNQKPSGG